MCHMNRCSQNGIGWEIVSHAYGGPSSDHTGLPTGSSHQGKIQIKISKISIFRQILPKKNKLNLSLGKV